MYCKSCSMILCHNNWHFSLQIDEFVKVGVLFLNLGKVELTGDGYWILIGSIYFTQRRNFKLNEYNLLPFATHTRLLPKSGILLLKPFILWIWQVNLSSKSTPCFRNSFWNWFGGIVAWMQQYLEIFNGLHLFS